MQQELVRLIRQVIRTLSYLTGVQYEKEKCPIVQEQMLLS